MTPEKLVEKYKKNVLDALDSEDAEIIEAYVSLETDRRERQRDRSWLVFDWGGVIIFAAVIIALLIGFFTAIYNSDSYDQGYKKAVANSESIIQEQNDLYKATLQSSIDAMAQSIERLETQNATALTDKNSYCETNKTSTAPKGLGVLVLGD
jgi:hypothetical protein